MSFHGVSKEKVMKRILSLVLLTCLVSLIFPIQTGSAQTYYFSVDRETVDVYWQSDGTMDLVYTFVFTNSSNADSIDFVDIGVPTSDYDLSSVRALIDKTEITDIQRSPYVVPGVALGLGANAIRPGATGEVHVVIGDIRDVLYFGDEEGYASGLFSPTWFDKDFVYGNTDLTVSFHLPPGIQSEEPRWHESPSGWPEDAPSTGLDSDGRVLYVWHNPSANAYTAYVFGASFPTQYVPEEVLQEPDVEPTLSVSDDTIFGFCCFGGIGGVMILIVVLSYYSQRRRKLDYLPPKIAIEGHGIKRGLTAVESAILLETPLDRVLTMILFGLIKKGAARVTQEEPLEIETISPKPEDLRTYETEFLEAMAIKKKPQRQSALQKLAVNLVKSVQSKMKGFSLKETKEYYQSIVKKAWTQVETAQTPEVKSEKFAESIEWSMLDKNFEDRTRNVFRTDPVFMPVWWGMYRPSTGPATTVGKVSGTPTSVSVTHSKGGVSLPSLPGADFAASVVTGIQNTAGNLVSNLTDFTGGVTKTTNPPPPPSKATSGGRTSSGGHSCACACACACAGCACACAGGGR
jgi:hypothetical protein